MRLSILNESASVISDRVYSFRGTVTMIMKNNRDGVVIEYISQFCITISALVAGNQTCQCRVKRDVSALNSDDDNEK